MKQKRFAVFFSQINQDRIEVEAFTKEHAQSLATATWRKTNCPEIIGTEELGGEEK